MSLETARRVLQIEAQAIQDVLARLDANFEKAVDVLFACKGRVAVSGMGKSGLIGRKISATLSSTGTGTWACWRAVTRCWRFPTAEKPRRSFNCWKR